MPCHDTCCQPEADTDYTVIGRRSVRHTRKEHKCHMCWKQIEIGSPAEVTAVLVGNKCFSDYRHPYPCWEH